MNGRRIFLLSLLVGLTLSVGLLVQFNPNIRFKKFQKQVYQSYQQQIGALPDSNYALRIQEPIILQAERRFYEHHLLNFYPQKPDHLNRQNRTAWFQLKKQMQDRLLEIKRLRADPSLYNLGGELKQSLVNKRLSKHKKWLFIEKQLSEAPRYYTAAKENLLEPDVDKTRSAIDKQLLTLHFLRSELLDSLAHSELSEPQKQAIVQHAITAQIAVKDYLAFCRSLVFEHQDAALKQ